MHHACHSEAYQVSYTHWGNRENHQRYVITSGISGLFICCWRICSHVAWWLESLPKCIQLFKPHLRETLCWFIACHTLRGRGGGCFLVVDSYGPLLHLIICHVWFFFYFRVKPRFCRAQEFDHSCQGKCDKLFDTVRIKDVSVFRETRTKGRMNAQEGIVAWRD